MPSKRNTSICQVCGIVFPVDPYLIAKGYGKFCTLACRGLSRRGAFKHTDESFWASLDRTTECWIWTGHTAHKYGQIRFDGKMWRAHKLAWVLTHGPISGGLFVLHNCPSGDNPACCRPEHLWLGTQAENIADMIAKGRNVSTDRRRAIMKQRAVRGDDHPWRKRPELIRRGEASTSARVTDDIVREIRARYDAGGILQRELASEYGLSREQVGGIVRRTEWRHVL